MIRTGSSYHGRCFCVRPAPALPNRIPARTVRERMPRQPAAAADPAATIGGIDEARIMQPLEFWQLAIIFVLIGYLALCFGLVAKRNGRNP